MIFEGQFRDKFMSRSPKRIWCLNWHVQMLHKEIYTGPNYLRLLYGKWEGTYLGQGNHSLHACISCISHAKLPTQPSLPPLFCQFVKDGAFCASGFFYSFDVFSVEIVFKSGKRQLSAFQNTKSRHDISIPYQHLILIWIMMYVCSIMYWCILNI